MSRTRLALHRGVAVSLVCDRGKAKSQEILKPHNPVVS
jgi:hypothetical protein